MKIIILLCVDIEVGLLSLGRYKYRRCLTVKSSSQIMLWNIQLWKIRTVSSILLSNVPSIFFPSFVLTEQLLNLIFQIFFFLNMFVTLLLIVNNSYEFHFFSDMCMYQFWSIIMQPEAAPRGITFVPSLFMSFVLLLCCVIIACAVSLMI